MAESARYAVASYGEERCQLLSAAWAHKMQYYYGVWVASGQARYMFQVADHDAYQEPEHFTALYGALQGQALARVDQIRALKPTRPI